jgi:hypothetical protein
MATSSQIIKDALRSNYAVPLCFVKLHMLLSPILIGILNLECAVCPPSNIDAAIPDVAVAMAINPLDRSKEHLVQERLARASRTIHKKNLALVKKDMLNYFIKPFSMLVVNRIKKYLSVLGLQRHFVPL